MAEPIDSYTSDLDDTSTVSDDDDLPVFAGITAEMKVELKNRGYLRVPGVISPEEARWVYAKMKEFISALSPDLVFDEDDNVVGKMPPTAHRIFQHFGAGHTQFMWFLRKHPNVMRCFANLHGVREEDLLTSFDAFCFMEKNLKIRSDMTFEAARTLSKHWTHIDYATTNKKPTTCVQGLVNILPAYRGGLMVYPFSHLFFPKLRTEFGIVESKNFVQLPNHVLIAIQTDARRFFPDSHPYSLQNRPDKPFPIMPIIVEAEPGDMLFWDSSTWHQNVYQCDRAALYICMLPRQLAQKNAFEKRRQAFLNHRTTSHWADRAKLNSPKPNTRGKEPFVPGDVSHLIVNTLEELGSVGRRLVGM